MTNAFKVGSLYVILVYALGILFTFIPQLYTQVSLHTDKELCYVPIILKDVIVFYTLFFIVIMISVLVVLFGIG
jgi:hypothetical protein